MKRLLIALCILLSTACAGKRFGPEVPPETPAVNTDGVLQIVGKFGYASACPVNGLVLTAAHVINPFVEEFGQDRWTTGHAWSTRAGDRGYLKPVATRPNRDLAALYIKTGKLSHFYKSAQEEPVAGDTLYWLEYVPGEPLDTRLQEAELVRTVAGHLVMNSAPTPGASGSCLFNTDEEVVGIVTWAFYETGIAVSVAGEWWPR